MNRFYPNEISTTREIRLSRNNANFIRTKGIVNRSVLCTTDELINIGEMPFGIANKINRYCNMEVYAESKWNLVQCMDTELLKRLYTSAIESVVTTANEESNQRDIEIDTNDVEDVVSESESDVVEDADTNTGDDNESTRTVEEEIVEDTIEEDDVDTSSTKEEAVIEEEDIVVDEDTVEEDEAVLENNDTEEEEVITRSQAPVTTNNQVTRPNNKYNNKKYSTPHRKY